MTVRNLQHDGATLFTNDNRLTIEVPQCKGYYISGDRGHDGLCCARCHILRKMIYEDSAFDLQTSNELAIFNLLYQKYPFIEHVVVKCNNSVSIVYPKRDYKGDLGLLERNMKDLFLFRKENGIMDKEIQHCQIYSRTNYPPIIMPNENTQKRVSSDKNDGVTIDKNGILTVTDLDKAFASGKYMYIINYYQAFNLMVRKDDQIHQYAIF